MYHILLVLFMLYNLSTVLTRESVGTESIFCPIGCVCGPVKVFLDDIGDLDLVRRGESPTSEIETRELSSVVTGTTILKNYHRVYHVQFAGKAIACARHNFTTLPALQLSSSESSNRITVLILRCGYLTAIASKNLPISLRIADFSHNNIRYLSREDLKKLANLLVLNLQYNLISKVPSPTGTLRIPSFNQRKPAILLEGNPLLCSCDLYTFIAHHIGRDRATCSMAVNTTLNKSNNSLNKSDFRADAPRSLPLHFFDYVSSELSRYCFGSRSMTFADFISTQSKNIREYNLIHDKFNTDEILVNRTIEAFERRMRSVDYPLLITMTGWFLMVFIGLFKFIRSNSRDYEMHNNYLSKLSDQENPVIGPITPIPSKERKIKSKRAKDATNSSVSLIQSHDRESIAR